MGDTMQLIQGTYWIFLGLYILYESINISGIIGIIGATASVASCTAGVVTYLSM